MNSLKNRICDQGRASVFIEFFFGAIAGICLALSFKPSEFRYLALLSTVLMFWRLKEILNRGHSLRDVFALCFSFLLLSRALFFRNDLYLLMNKTQLPSIAYQVVFGGMTLQVILLPIFLVIILHAFMKRIGIKRGSVLAFFCLLSTFLLMEIGSFWTLLVSPVVSIGNYLKWITLFSAWGHLAITFFYYASLSVVFAFEKKRLFIVAIFCIIFISPLLFYKKDEAKNEVTFVTVNQKFSIINQDNTFSPDPIEYMKNLSRILSENESLDGPIYLWNESAIVQLANQKTLIDNIKRQLGVQIKGTHFLGNIILSKRQDTMSGVSRYDLIEEGNVIASHQKRYLVPLDENLTYFPWLPRKYFLNPLSIEKGGGLKGIENKGVRYGVLLCNEIAEILKLSLERYYSNVDIIINPSNVPDLFENSYEEFLDEFALWTHLVTGKPVLRTSNQGRVTLFQNSIIENDFKTVLNSKIINLKINQYRP